VAGSCKHFNQPLGFLKYGEFFWLAEELSLLIRTVLYGVRTLMKEYRINKLMSTHVLLQKLVDRFSSRIQKLFYLASAMPRQAYFEECGASWCSLSRLWYGMRVNFFMTERCVFTRTQNKF
jgi:hypothetical protein